MVTGEVLNAVHSEYPLQAETITEAFENMLEQ